MRTQSLNERYGVKTHRPSSPKKANSFSLISVLKAVGIALTAGAGYTVLTLAQALLG